MVGCCRASSLLCSFGLLKCNGISVFWFLAAFSWQNAEPSSVFYRQRSHSPGPTVNSGSPRRNKYALRERPGDEGISSVSAPACADQEDHVLPALELGSGLAEVFFTVDRLLVHLQDDHAGLQLDIVTERVRLYVRDLNALAFRRSHAFGHFRRNRFHGDAQLCRHRLAFCRGIIGLFGPIIEQFGAISHYYGRLFFLAVAKI